MTTLQAPAAAAVPPHRTSPDWLTGRPGLVLMWLSIAGCAAGLVAGLVGGPLWLDEALSVEIARLPVPDLLDALRRDGSPPLYYLLLHAWISVVGTGTVAVRLLTVLLVPVALLLTHRLGRRIGGAAAARASVVVLASLPWTMRFGSETRMYLLVVVLVLAGALALLAVRTGPSRRRVAALAACVGALLLTHYWALFLLLVVGLLHVPGMLRRRPAALRVALAFVLGAAAFLPWLPSFLFQATHTGAPWADPPGVLELFRTPRYWGGGSTPARTLLALVLVPLAVLGAWPALARRLPRLRSRLSPSRLSPSRPSPSGALPTVPQAPGADTATPPARALLAVVAGTLALAWTTTAVAGGAYTGRYTAVVVPVFAVAAGLGAVALAGRRAPLVAVGVAAAIGVATGVPAAAVPRASAADIASTFVTAAQPGDVLAYCPDQLGPPVARAIGAGYEQVVYPTFGPPQLIDWVDYAERNEAADPVAFARRLDALAGDRQLFVLKASGYRTFDRDCERVLASLADRRGLADVLFGDLGTTGQQLYRFDAG